MTDTPDFGEKEFSGVGYPTPLSIPNTIACRSLPIPADGSWQALVMGMLLTGIYPENWQQMEGGITREAAAERWAQMVYDAYDFQTCEVVQTPYWDDDNGDDADNEAPAEMQPWYGELVIVDDRLTWKENVAIWAVTAFIALAGKPGAAISFLPIARNFVVEARTSPLGGFVRFLFNGVEIQQADTYSASEGVKSVPISLPAPAMGLRALDADSDTFWVEFTGDANPAVVGDPIVELIRMRLTEDDFSPSNMRYNPETDQIEITPDGGMTWNPAPGSDPRHSPAFLKPPVTGSNKQCDAAANMIKWLKDFMDEVIRVLEIGGIAASIANTALDFVDLLFPGAVFIELLVEFGATVFGIGGTALDAAFTSDQYDLLKCIFYCHADANGQISADALAQIESDITAQLNTTAALVVNAILFFQGEIGLSNAGSIGSETGDCSACACEHCFVLDFADGDGSAVGFTLQGGTYIDACCMQGTSPLPDFANVYGYWAFGASVHVTSIEMEFSKPGGSGSDNVNWLNVLSPATGWDSTTILRDTTNPVDPSGAHMVKHMDVDLDCDGVGFDINMGGFVASPSTVYKLRVFYTGDIPSGWSDNC